MTCADYVLVNHITTLSALHLAPKIEHLGAGELPAYLPQSLLARSSHCVKTNLSTPPPAAWPHPFWHTSVYQITKMPDEITTVQGSPLSAMPVPDMKLEPELVFSHNVRLWFNH